MSQSQYLNYQLSKYAGAKAKSESISPMGLGDSHPITMTRFDPPIPRPQYFGALNERQQLKAIGVGEVHATLAIPYLYYLPRTSDADAQGVQVIVAALQRALGVPDTGYMGDRTANAIATVSGSGWFDKRWNEIIGDVLTRKPRAQAMSGYVSIGDSVFDKMTQIQKLLLVGGVATGIYLIARKK